MATELLRAEARRWWSHPLSLRFFVFVMLAVVLLIGFEWSQHHSDVDRALQEAQQTRQEALEVIQMDSDASPDLWPFYVEPRLFWATDAPIDLRVGLTALAAVALIWAGALAGRDWQLGLVQNEYLWEPSRIRLGVARALGAGLAAMVFAAMAAVVLAVGLLVVARWRGSMASVDSEVIATVVGTVVRGCVLVGLFAVLGVAIADYFRNPSALLVVALLYLVLVEPALRFAIPGFESWLLSNLSFDWIGGSPAERLISTVECGLDQCPEILPRQWTWRPGLALGGVAGAALTGSLWASRRDIVIP